MKGFYIDSGGSDSGRQRHEAKRRDVYVYVLLRIVIIAVIVSDWMYTFPLRMDTLKPASAMPLNSKPSPLYRT
ncbi:MAG TPA: hypothetical protein VGI33_00135 [Paenibacillus sp.]